MKKQCIQCSKTFMIKPDDQVFYDKVQVPTPTHCPDCRQQRRLAWRNERFLYSGKCAMCKQTIISMYSTDKQFTIYCSECWWGDRWNPLDYGLIYDPAKPFFDQFKDLMQHVPRMALTNRNCENSDYAPWAVDGKNLYLSAGGRYNENCMYGMFPTYSKDCLDFIMPDHCELCYEIIECTDCYQVLFSERCTNCRECYFSYDCRNSNNCFGCIGLRNKQYYWFNEPLTKEEYTKRFKRIQWTNETISELQKQFAEAMVRYPHKAIEQIHCEKSTGDLLKNCQSVQHGFNVHASEYSSFVYDVREAKDSYDLFIGGFNNELTYECHSSLDTTSSLGLNVCWDGNSSIFYCDHCFSAHDLFGCIGLRQRQYCILNTQYDQATYTKLKTSIMDEMRRTQEWGEFFPIHLSPFAYNETVAQEYYPLTADQAQRNGWHWLTPDTKTYQPQTISVAAMITEVPNTITRELLSCSQCQKNYKILKEELTFYRNLNLPIPILCPYCRHLKRMQLRNPRTFWQRQCMCTQIDHQHQGRCITSFETTYSPDRKEIVYCEQCYQKEIY